MRVTSTERRSSTGAVSREYKMHVTYDSATIRTNRGAAYSDNEPAKTFPVKVSETPCRTAQG